MIWTTQQRSKFGPIAAIERGAGPLVVMIHGVGLRAEAWAAQIDALAHSFRVLAVDMPGHGGSAPFAQPPHLAQYSDAIASLIDVPAIVIGHSFGAMIALDIATRFPAKVKAVAALNAIFKRDALAKAAVQSRAAALDGVSPPDPAGPLARWFGETPSAHKDACHAWLTGVDPAGYRDAYRVFAAQDGPDVQALQQLACPALFLTGGKEPNSTPRMSRQMAAIAPYGVAAVVAQAAHMMPMTHAGDVNAQLVAFLAQVRP